jgi:hypothetical protein
MGALLLGYGDLSARALNLASILRETPVGCVRESGADRGSKSLADRDCEMPGGCGGLVPFIPSGEQPLDRAGKSPVDSDGGTPADASREMLLTRGGEPSCDCGCEEPVDRDCAMAFDGMSGKSGSPIDDLRSYHAKNNRRDLRLREVSCMSCQVSRLRDARQTKSESSHSSQLT